MNSAPFNLPDNTVFDHNKKTLWDLSAEREQPMSEEEIEEIRREIVK